MDVAADPLSPITRRCLDRADRDHHALEDQHVATGNETGLSGMGLKEPVRVPLTAAPPIGRAASKEAAFLMPC